MSVTQAILSYGALAVGVQLVYSGIGAAIDAHQEGTRQNRHLEIAELAYVEIDGLGAVRQRVVSVSGEIIPAAWSASIERNIDGITHILCTGSGDANYNGEVSTWTLADWTDDDCPDVAQDGDFFEVSWTYTNGYGNPVTLGGRYQLTNGDLVFSNK